MLGHEGVVVEVGITVLDPVQFVRLSRGQRLRRIQTNGFLQQSPDGGEPVNASDASQNPFAASKIAALASVTSTARDIRSEGMTAFLGCPAAALPMIDRGASPTRPVTEQPANEPQFLTTVRDAPSGQQIQKDMVVIARVERDVAARPESATPCRTSSV